MKLVIFMIGLLIGALLALGFIEQYAIYTPLETQRDVVTALKPVTVNKCSAGLEPVNYSCNVMAVQNNYVNQKTANINVLEPKVSDVYLQNAPNTAQVTRNSVFIQGSL